MQLQVVGHDTVVQIIQSNGIVYSFHYNHDLFQWKQQHFHHLLSTQV